MLLKCFYVFTIRIKNFATYKVTSKEDKYTINEENNTGIHNFTSNVNDNVTNNITSNVTNNVNIKVTSSESLILLRLK